MVSADNTPTLTPDMFTPSCYPAEVIRARLELFTTKITNTLKSAWS